MNEEDNFIEWKDQLFNSLTTIGKYKNVQKSATYAVATDQNKGIGLP